jgi:hypothetical protein
MKNSLSTAEFQTNGDLVGAEVFFLVVGGRGFIASQDKDASDSEGKVE